MKANSTRKRLLSILLTLMMVLGTFPALGSTTALAAPSDSAEKWVEIGGPGKTELEWMDELEALLESEETKYIRLADDIDYAGNGLPEGSSFWEYGWGGEMRSYSHWDDDIIGSTDYKYMERSGIYTRGTKYIDLNGYELGYSWNQTYWYNPPSEFTFMTITDGSDVTILDSSESKDGRIDIDGYLHYYYDGQGAVGCRRDVFCVQDGGTLTINGGEIVAGHSKEHWLTNYVRYPAKTSYTGYARNQVSGRVATVEDGGKLYINGGSLYGRGIDPGVSDYHRLCAISIKSSGYVEVRDAEIWGMGCADVFQGATPKNLKVYSGYFNTHKVEDVILHNRYHPSNDKIFDLSSTNAGVRTGSYGNVNIPEDSIDWKNCVVEQNHLVNRKDQYFMECDALVEVRPNSKQIKIVDKNGNAGYGFYTKNYNTAFILKPDFIDSDNTYWPQDLLGEKKDATCDMTPETTQNYKAEWFVVGDDGYFLTEPNIWENLDSSKKTTDADLALNLSDFAVKGQPSKDFEFEVGKTYNIFCRIWETYNGYTTKRNFIATGYYQLTVTDDLTSIGLRMDKGLVEDSFQYFPEVSLSEAADYQIKSQTNWKDASGKEAGATNRVVGAQPYTKTVVLEAINGKKFSKGVKIQPIEHSTNARVTKFTETEVTVEIEAMAPHTHSYKWMSNGAGHVKGCTCGLTQGKREAHHFDEGVTISDGIKYTCSVCGYEYKLSGNDLISDIRVKSSGDVVFNAIVPTVEVDSVFGFLGTGIVTLTDQKWYYSEDPTTPLTPGTDKFMRGKYYLDLTFDITDNHFAFNTSGFMVLAQLRDQMVDYDGFHAANDWNATFSNSNRTASVRLEVDVPEAVTLKVTLPKALNAGDIIEITNAGTSNNVNVSPGPVFTPLPNAGFTSEDIQYSAEWRIDGWTLDNGQPTAGRVAENSWYYLVIHYIELPGNYVVGDLIVENPEDLPYLSHYTWFTDYYTMSDGNRQTLKHFYARYYTEEDDKLVHDVSVTVEPPTAGAKPAVTAFKGGDSDKYDVTAVTWWPADETFAADKSYFVGVTVKMKPGYHFNGWTTYSINDILRTDRAEHFSIAPSLGSDTVRMRYQFPACHTHTFTKWMSMDEDYSNHYRTCTSCGYVDVAEHDWTKWTDDPTDEYSHKHTCKTCGITETGGHVISEPIIDQYPTPDEDGEQHTVCEICGKLDPKSLKKPTPKKLLPKLSPIDSVNVTVTKPVKDAVPENAATTETGYTIEKTEWNPAHNPFSAGTDYTVTVTVVPDEGSAFRYVGDDVTTLSINGETIKPDYLAPDAAVFHYTFPCKSGSYSSIPTNYTLTFDTNGGGKVDSISKASGTSIDLASYKPTKDGYTFDGWYADAKLTDNVTSVKLTKDTTVYAKWTKNAEPDPTPGTGLPFTDVKSGDWFYDDVAYVFEKGLMNGTDSTTFSPSMTTTRGMIVTVLYRQAGSPAVSGDCPFADVKSGMYYEAPIAWAAANGIVKGYSAEQYGPEDPITREQMAAILYRYAQYKGVDVSAAADLSQFKDAEKVSDWAKDAIAWTVQEGILNGVGDNLLSPGTQATRAQIATILHRFCENITK